jgi:hypothetical protein
MGLAIPKMTTSKTIVHRLPQCHTCRERKGGLFTVDVNGRPQCADCARKAGKPII